MKTKAKPSYTNEIRNLLEKLPHELQISFALYCAMDVSHLVPPKHKAKANLYIDLVQRWLKGEQGLEDELRAAANAAYSAANAAATSAASAAANAAYAAAYNAAYAYAYAANAAANAAYAANAAGNSDKIKEYYEYLVNIVREMPEIEKLMLNIEIDI